MRTRGIVLILAIAGVFAAHTSAQVRELSVQEYDNAMKAASEATDGKTRRVTVTTTDTDKAKRPQVRNSVYEYMPPDRFHSRPVSADAAWEYIEVGEHGYFRDKGKPWEYFAMGGSDIPPYLFWWPKSAGPGTEIRLSRVREEKLNGKKVLKYSRECVQNFESPKGHPPTPPVLGIEDIWVGTDGTFLKAEASYYDAAKTTLVQTWSLTFEYNPKDLKIEAPIK